MIAIGLIISTQWINYVQGIHLRSYAQQNPLRDYQNEGHELFDIMMQNIEEDTCKFILKSVVQVEDNIEREKQQSLVKRSTFQLKMVKKSETRNQSLKVIKLVVTMIVHVVVVKFKLPWKINDIK